MNRTNRRRFRPECSFDRLESRELLNGHVPKAHHLQVHISDHGLQTPPAISGTINGTSSYTGKATGTDTYSLAGTASAGLTWVTGTDSFSSKPAGPNTYLDLYYNGNWEMHVDGSKVKIAYTGPGYDIQPSGAFVEHLTGTAIGISGPLRGQSFSFSGVVSGPGSTPATTLTFKLSS